MKKKILIFLLVFIIMLMPVLTFAYAIPSHVQNAIDSYQHRVIFYSSYSDYPDRIGIWLLNSDDPSSKVKVKNNGSGIDGYIDKAFTTQDGGITWTEYGGGNHGGGFNFPYGTPAEDIIIESTFDLYKNDGTLFFSPPRPPIPVLVEIMEGVDSGMILKIILVGLTHLVGFLVLAICLRKGWAFLRRQLAT